MASAWPDDEQVRAAPAQTVLALDAPPAVHHPLQERLQEKLRTGLYVVEASQPVLRVLAEECLEGGKQLVDVEAAVGVDVPGGILNEPRLRRVGEFTRHDFGVDGVGDTRGIVAGDQPEVADVLEVMGRELALVGAAQQRLDDAAHAVFLELVGKLVEVDLPALDKMLAGVEDVGGGDRAGSVAPCLAGETDPAAERVHQPRLALGLPPYTVSSASGVNACPVSAVC